MNDAHAIKFALWLLQFPETQSEDTGCQELKTHTCGQNRG